MNILRALLVPAALATVLIPATGLAQVQPQPPTTAGAPAPQGAFHRHRNLWTQAMRGISLSDQQKAQIQQLIAQYRQTHPAGTPPDRQARKQLHDQIAAVLTPAQQAQLKANLERLRQEQHQHMVQERSSNQGPVPQPSPTP